MNITRCNYPIFFYILFLNSVNRSGSPYETQISEKVAHTTTDDARKWISKIITLFHLDTNCFKKEEFCMPVTKWNIYILNADVAHCCKKYIILANLTKMNTKKQ
jgi:hypothetical protein